MTLLGFKTILHKKCMSSKNSEGPAETGHENKFQKVCYHTLRRVLLIRWVVML